MWGRRVESIDKNKKIVQLPSVNFPVVPLTENAFSGNFYRGIFFMGIFFIFFGNHFSKDFFPRRFCFPRDFFTKDFLSRDRFSGNFFFRVLIRLHPFPRHKTFDLFETFFLAYLNFVSIIQFYVFVIYLASIIDSRRAYIFITGSNRCTFLCSIYKLLRRRQRLRFKKN